MTSSILRLLHSSQHCTNVFGRAGFLLQIFKLILKVLMLFKAVNVAKCINNSEPLMLVSVTQFEILCRYITFRETKLHFLRWVDALGIKWI